LQYHDPASHGSWDSNVNTVDGHEPARESPVEIELLDNMQPLFRRRKKL